MESRELLSAMEIMLDQKIGGLGQAIGCLDQKIEQLGRKVEKLDMAFETAVECWGQCVESQRRIDILERKTQHLPEPKAS